MTFVSKLALAAVLSLGAVSVGAAPAAAQKKDEKGAQAGAPQLKVSPEFRKVAAPAEVAVKAKDWAAAEPNIVAAEGLAKNDDEKYFAASLRLQLELGRNNVPGQLQVLNTLMANPKTPPEAVRLYGSVYNYQMGLQAYSAKKYSETIQLLTKARELGSTEADLPVVLANAYSASGKQAESIAEVERAIAASKAAGRKPPAEWYQFAIPKVNASGDRSAMVSWLSRFLTEYPTVKNWRWAIMVFRNSTPAGANEKVEKLDLYRLLRNTNALADRGDYADYAYAAQQSGLPWESVAVIEEGRAKGKLPTGDADTARTLTAAQAAVRAEGSLDATAGRATTAAALSQTADAYLASGNYARAIALYDAALAKGAANPDVINLHRGIAFARQGQKEEARTAFAAVKPGPSANLATLWATSLDLPPLGPPNS